MAKLIMNLFKGYMRAKDKVFRQWLQRQKDDYITRRTVINPNGLEFMEEVENYYKDRLRSGEWMKLDEDQETILQRNPPGNRSHPNLEKLPRENAMGKPSTGASTIKNGVFIPRKNVARKMGARTKT
mmetsp:Transcript_13677/g.19601  ORF Transcript_13677/g.19601 Transcript_13677/m.19601 type:complete len:127 (+) Transcript_13677:723-1103(+)